MREALNSRPRAERRAILNAEASARKTGKWGAWERITFPKGTAGNRGWHADFQEIFRNSVFAVLSRDVTGDDGKKYRHLAITSLSEQRPTWPEAQRIKDELCGQSSTAVEVYPPAHELVDDANMYHLWVLPDRFPVSLKREGM